MRRAVQHIALNCRSRTAQERFYCKHFGLKRARVFHAGTEGAFVMLKLGSVRLELFQARNVPPGATGGSQPVGFAHFCFEVPDVARKAEELKADGLTPGEVIDCGHQVPGLKVCFLKDPEGNVVELMEGWQDDPTPPPLA